jgi:hypothetical protein
MRRIESHRLGALNLRAKLGLHFIELGVLCHLIGAGVK